VRPHAFVSACSVSFCFSSGFGLSMELELAVLFNLVLCFHVYMANSALAIEVPALNDRELTIRSLKGG